LPAERRRRRDERGRLPDERRGLVLLVLDGQVDQHEGAVRLLVVVTVSSVPSSCTV
jgi:hypothetical protein